jgi:type VI protein secretion system component VasK
MPVVIVSPGTMLLTWAIIGVVWLFFACLRAVDEGRADRLRAEMERQREEKREQLRLAESEQQHRIERKMAIIERGEILDYCRRMEEGRGRRMRVVPLPN